MSVIVVGIDDSPAAREALRWAAAEARMRGAHLRVVHAWSPPYAAAGPSFVPELEPEVPETVRRRAIELIDHELAQIERIDRLDVERIVIEDAPAPALLAAAADADLLVVGSRGRGGFVGLLLGSVSQQCAQHTTCPIVIVPAHR